jgi:hypothetical protein
MREVNIHFIDEKDDFRGRIGCARAGDGLKGKDWLRRFVVEKREILLLQSGYRLPGFIGHDDA